MAIYLFYNYGYLGVFLMELIASSSILFPVPSYLATAMAGALLNPYLVVLSASLGSTIGELSGYALGLGGRKVMGKRLELRSLKRAYAKYGIWAILVFAAMPIPFDIIGILCGIIRIPVGAFMALTFIGKLVRYSLLVIAGRRTRDLVRDFLAGRLNSFAILYLIILSAFALGSLLLWRLMCRKCDEVSDTPDP
ncbi:MAG: VTT domain-containing protein [Candidatus Bathyarchaeia archaeon]